MEKEGVIRPGVLHEPVHCAQDVLLRRLADRVLLVVCEDDHVIPLVSIGLVQEGGHVLHVVDASSELPPLAKVVDADQERLSPPGAVGVLERIMLRSTRSEGLRCLRRRRGRLCIAIHIRVSVDGGHGYQGQ